MKEKYQNIYKTTRRAAGYTQESAAEWIGVSVESIRAYETNRRIPPGDVVERMVRCYHAPHLAYEHLQVTNSLLSYVVPELEQRGVLESAARAYLSLKRGLPSAERLLELAQDGEIAPTHQEEFDQLVEVLQEMIQPCLELEVYWHGRQTKPAARSGRRKKISGDTWISIPALQQEALGAQGARRIYAERIINPKRGRRPITDVRVFAGCGTDQREPGLYPAEAAR